MILWAHLVSIVVHIGHPGQSLIPLVVGLTPNAAGQAEPQQQMKSETRRKGHGPGSYVMD